VKRRVTDCNNANYDHAIAWFLWLYILEKLPAGVAGMGSLAIPLVGVMSAWLQLGERPGPFEAAGMLLIGLALLILSLYTLRAGKEAIPE
jgi:drug/metabolite transporter (DMT)-like permease